MASDPLTTEEWRPVLGYEGLYEVSELGRIRRLTFVNGTTNHTYPTPRVIPPKAKGRGYVSVNLHRDGRSSTRTVHRVVAEAFHGPKPDGTECAHLNGVRHDNRAVNLRWVSRKENHSHKWLHGTQQAGERHGQSKLKRAQVAAMLMMHESGATIPEIMAVFDEEHGTIWCIVNRKSWRDVVTPLEQSVAESARLRDERDHARNLFMAEQKRKRIAQSGRDQARADLARAVEALTMFIALRNDARRREEEEQRKAKRGAKR